MESERGEVKIDRWGSPVRTSSDACISAINSYYEQFSPVLVKKTQFLNYGRNRSVILEASVHDKDCVLGNILAAHFLYSSNSARASTHLESARARLERATVYERAVFEAVSSLFGSGRDDDVAFELHKKLLKQFPKDLVSLKRAQLLCFYIGRPDLSLALVEQVLPQNREESYVYGMLSFPLLELGRMSEASEAAKKGYEINPNDVWSQHNLCHVFQYECDFQEAVDFMKKCSSSWHCCSSFMYTHNWWHVAVCYLESSSAITKVLEIYDHNIWKELQKSDVAYLEVYLNALALLVRVYVRGPMDAFGERLKILADCVMDQSLWNLEWHFDILAVWALASTKREARAEDLLKTMKSRIRLLNSKKQLLMQRGILLAEVMFEYGRGNYDSAFRLLSPDFDSKEYKMIGASDEQLDVFNEVWYCILLHTGQYNKAIEVLEKQVENRHGIPFLWRLLERGYSMAGRRQDAILAVKRASALEAAYS
ncbi:hypothetical protein Scep_017561 [Stephania cephalantha]|uniref:Tetratricopeptide repeat protein 38 n=1 Tax=Stephania cephalantha TaxID=152367 RepID=A0AAP0NUC3_9MAGN